MEPKLTRDDIRRIVLTELPTLLREDKLLRHDVEAILAERFVEKEPFEERFDRILDELRRDREEQSRKWEEQTLKSQEQDRRWEEQSRKWDEQQARWDEFVLELRELRARDDRIERRIDTTIGALGARWGLSSEKAFRDALRAILEDSFGVKVERYLGKDPIGEVFDWPDQIEIDVVIRDGEVLAVELKSSMSPGDVGIFDRKVAFYEKATGRKVTRKLIVSPMIDARARRRAAERGIEMFSNPEDVTEGGE